MLKSLERAQRRGVGSYVEIASYGSANDGFNMLRYSAEGLNACLRQAFAGAEKRGTGWLDYIDSHRTGTKPNDPLEVQLLQEVLAGGCPSVSSMKSLVGHALGAGGAQEAVLRSTC